MVQRVRPRRLTVVREGHHKSKPIENDLDTMGFLGPIIPVADAKHDVFLSRPQPRQMAYRQLDLWLDDYLNPRENTDAPASSGKG